MDGILPVIDRMILDKHYNDAMNLIESFKDIDVLETGKRLISIHRQLGNKIQVANGLVSLGDFHATVGMLKEALDYYKEALLMNPNDDSIRAKIMELQKGEKTVDEVLEDADIFLSYGLYDEAKEVLEKLKGQEPENIEIHEKLKSLYENINDKEMKDQDESYWAMKYDLAEAYEKNGNFKEAIDLYIEVHDWDSKFRGVSDKINQFKTLTTKSTEEEKPRGRKDRISYI